MSNLVDCFLLITNYEPSADAKKELKEYWVIPGGEEAYQELVGVRVEPWSTNLLLEHFSPEYRGQRT